MSDLAPSSGSATVTPLWASPAAWVVLSLICVAIDYWTGPAIQFPAAYLLPTSLAAWHGGWRWGIAFAAALPLVRLSFMSVWNVPWTLVEESVNAMIRIGVFALFAWLIGRAAGQMHDLRRTQVLEGLLGVCSVCKSIHNERTDEWQPLDVYAASLPPQARPEVCPRCMRQANDVFDRR
jgi:hypothetical protein